MEHVTFNVWFQEVMRICENLEGLLASMSKDDWEEFYHDGYTPQEAVNECIRKD